MKKTPTVHSHSYQHFENVQLSAKEFYNAIKDAIKPYDFPKLGITEKVINEFGYLTNRREYLCIFYYDLEFNICAAPFGKNFFISWWLKETNTPIRDFFAAIPIFGVMFRKPAPSFYRIDTELIFSKSIDAIVRSVITRFTASHGYHGQLVGNE